MRRLFLLGRMLVGGYFFFSGIRHFNSMATLSQAAARRAVPYPGLAVGVSGVLLVVGGSSLLLGVLPRLGLGALVLFLVPVSLVMHQFWNFDGPKRRAEMVNFTKNVALLGSALMFLGVPEPWPYSLPLRRAPLLRRRTI